MDLSTATSAFASMQTMSYLLILIIFIIEGPIANYVAAFAASLGFFNVYFILFLALLGNVVGDMILFIIGKLRKKTFIEKYLTKRIGEAKVQQIKDHLKKKPLRTLLIIKLTPIIPTPGLILTGSTDMSAKKFFYYSFLISFFYSVFFVVLGFYSGEAFNIIFKYFKYGTYLAGALAILVIVLWLVFSKKVSEKVEKLI